MKTSFFYSLLFLLFWMTSCQDHYYDNPSNPDIQKQLLLDLSFIKSNQIIENDIAKMIRSMNNPDDVTPQKRLLAALNQIIAQTDSLDASVDNIREHLTHLAGKNKALQVDKKRIQDFFYTKKSSVNQVQMLSNKYVALYQNCIYLVEELFEHRDLRGTIFGDYNKKVPSIKVLKEDLEAFSFAPIDKLNLKNKALFQALSTLSAFQNEVRQLEYAWLSFLILHSTKLCRGGYQRFDLFANSKTTCIHLGEQYKADILVSYPLTKNNPSIQVDGAILPIELDKATYLNKPSVLGKYSYTVKAIFQHPKTEKRDTIQDIFSFYVSP